MKLFKPEEFKGCETNEDCVYLANAKLNALIVAAPVVYAHEKNNLWFTVKDATLISNYKASLMFIEEIVKEPCKHEPYQSNANIILTSNPPQLPKPVYKCAKCGVELQATWSESK